MKKISIAKFILITFFAFTFAQPAAPSLDSLKVTQKSETAKLAKKTIVIPSKSPTNWSKIKDLFR
jgi:hypothetical protein